MYLGVALLAVAISAVLAGILYQWVGMRTDRRRFPPPGGFDAGGLHVRETGAGPAVILEAGIAASSVGWVYVEALLARFARCVSYDRAGFGWSTARRSGGTSGQLRDLRTVVEAARAGGPYVLVGHSFGALLVYLFAASEPPPGLAGVVLVDPPFTPPPQTPLERGARFARRGAWLARIGFVRLGLALAAAGRGRLAARFARVSTSPGGQKTVERLAGELSKLPRELLPVVQAHWSRPGPFSAMADNLDSLPELCRQVGVSPPLRVPLVVISGAHLSPEALEEHRAFAARSALGRQVVAARGAHWVHLDEPELIARVVADLYR